MAGIVHKTSKVSGEKGLASEWNDDHKITGDVDAENHKFINVLDPVANQDAATRKYVLDSLNNNLLDWDTCWVDAVHSHANDAEGGKLAWNNVWIDSVHDHSGAAQGGLLDWDTCWVDAAHTHANAGEGGQLIWDNVWSDSVHNHGDNAEGGLLPQFHVATGHDHDGVDSKKLDWDLCWTDAVHDHSNAANGGLLDWDTCWTDAVHNHTDNANGGLLPQFDTVTGHDHDGVDSKKLDWDLCWTDAVHNHSNAAEGGQFTDLTILGDYNMATETRYYAINPASYTPRYPDVNNVEITSGKCQADQDIVSFYAPVNLPHGAVVTNVIIHGNAAAEAETWKLLRVYKASIGAVTMAEANFNTADSTIDNATIDNSLYTYCISSSTFDSGDTIYGGTITYTITKPYP